MGMIERFNRTIKLLIAKYSTAYKTNKWIDELPELLQNYNAIFPPSKSRRQRSNTHSHESATKDGPDGSTQETSTLATRCASVAQKKENIFAKEGIKWSPEVHTVSEDSICTFKVEGDSRRYPHHVC